MYCVVFRTDGALPLLHSGIFFLSPQPDNKKQQQHMPFK